MILVVYTLRHVDPVDPVDAASLVPALAGIAVTTALHVWRGNMVLSLALGTETYVALASTIYA